MQKLDLEIGDMVMYDIQDGKNIGIITEIYSRRGLEGGSYNVVKIIWSYDDWKFACAHHESIAEVYRKQYINYRTVMGI